MKTSAKPAEKTPTASVVHPGVSHLRAWHVFQGEPTEGSLLIFASNRNRAKTVGFKKGPWEWEGYLTLSARRAPEWDKFALEERVIEANDELPKDAPPFYDDSCDG